MALIYSRNDREQAKHLATIHSLAQELGRPEGEVVLVYEAEFERLNNEARVKDFLALIVGRRVKETLLRAGSRSR
jgi:hypothetical protein